MANFYRFHTEPDKVVLFADILGFSNLIDKYDIDNPVEKGLGFDFCNVYKVISKEVEEAEKNHETPVKFLWMSDSMIFTGEIENIDEIIKKFLDVQRVLYTGGMYLEGQFVLIGYIMKAMLGVKLLQKRLI